MLFVEVGIPVKIHNIIRLDVQMYIRLCIRLIWTDVILNFEDMIQGLHFFPKVHWSRSSEHQGGFFVANSGYFTVITPHIYFIILISMIAGNLVEIRLPKLQSRKQKMSSEV